MKSRQSFTRAMFTLTRRPRRHLERMPRRRAQLPLAEELGPHPVIPAPTKELIPTTNVARALGWAVGDHPTSPSGAKVTAFASELQHPRWVQVLPNGDVLVAETNAPPKPEDHKGVKGWVMKRFMEKGGSAGPSANRITLLRDRDHDGKAELQSVFIEGLNSPLGMALVGNHLFVADTDAIVRFPYAEGETVMHAAGVKLVDLPAGPLNHHWTKNVIAGADGTKLYVAVGSNSNAGEERDRQEGRGRACRAGSGRSISRRARTACSRRVCGTRAGSPGSRPRGRSGPWSTSATSSAAICHPTI